MLLSQVPSGFPNVIQAFQEKQSRYGPDKWQWSDQELKNHLRKAMPTVLERNTVMLFVDALDEAGKDAAVSLIHYFKELSASLPERSHRKLKLLFSCRHYPNLTLNEHFEIDRGQQSARY